MAAAFNFQMPITMNSMEHFEILQHWVRLQNQMVTDSEWKYSDLIVATAAIPRIDFGEEQRILSSEYRQNRRSIAN